MQSTNVVKFPICPPVDDLSGLMIICAVSPHFKRKISFENKDISDGWYLDVRGSSIDELIDNLYWCKRAVPMIGRGAAKAEEKRGQAD